MSQRNGVLSSRAMAVWSFAAVLLLAAGSLPLQAQETGDHIYHFPHLAVGARWQTTITYINYSPQVVTCQTEFISDQGSPLMVSFPTKGTDISRTDVLPPGGSVHEETNVELNAPLAAGWARATCSGPVKASLLFRLYNSEGTPTAEAGVNATTVPATRFVTFAEQAEGMTGTGVAYANPSETAAHVTFTAKDTEGQTLASVVRTLLPEGHDAQVMSALFGFTSFSGSLEITSTEPIVSLSLNFETAPVFSSLPPGELDAAAQGKTMYHFPHLAVGDGWQTAITYINYSPQVVTCQSEFISDQGSPLMVSFPTKGTDISRTDVLPPGGSVHEETNVELNAPLAAGWARATCSGPVKASLLFRLYNSEGTPTAEAGVNAATVPATRFVTFAEQGEGKLGTGVAYANPFPTEALVTFTVRDADGQTLASFNQELPAGGHGAQNMAPLFDLNSFTGSLEITSTVPIVTLSLNFETAPVFSSLPPGELDAADISGGMLAPANESAFNDLFVGKRAATTDPTIYVDYLSPGRFREIEGADIWTGGYTYQNTGSNTGTLTFNYDDGDRCTSSLMFVSTTAATETYTCNEGSSGKYTWQLVEIPASAGAPDLVVRTPSVSESSPGIGVSFTLSATVSNAGDGESAATTLHYYRSTDATISMGDTEVGTDAVGALAAAGASDELISLTAPPTAGTYYYGACVDQVSGESNTQNNCSNAVTVTLSASHPDRAALVALYNATDGPNWVNNENWLTDAPLGDWYGVEVDDQGRVTELYFRSNHLTGRLPPELGSLANLRSLFIWLDGTTGPIPTELGNLANLQSLRLMGRSSHLTGPIPTELGNLASLQVLELWNNDLTGPIPTELGSLTNLSHLGLDQNHLSGPIPTELGRLANLNSLHLSKNDLTGPIPTGLGGLANMRSLNLASNRLSGPIPTELGGLANVESVYLGDNELTGPVPAVLGGLIHLRHLALQANPGMSGALPASLTNLASLETLQTSGTDLCAPSDAGFLDWLERVANRQVALCGHEPAMAYLVQAVQSREFPVPLVAGREALLRVFVTAGRDNDERLPPVRASFYLNGALAHVAEIAGGPGPIPTQVDEGSLATSANAAVPAELVQPGLEMVVEIDPDGTLESGLGVARRIPNTGRAAVDVRAVPLLDLTLVPFLWAADPDSTILEPVVEMAADPEGHELLEFMRTVLPVGDLDVKAHEPVLSSTNDGFELVELVRAIRVMEGGTGYWMGTMAGRWGTAIVGTGGIGRGAASFVLLDKALDVGPNRHFARVTAHEFGHNFSLGHAPSCGAGLPDSAYPQPDGSTGVWGYDFRDGSLVPPSWTDVMGYCEGDPEWISDYHFSKALHFRLFDEQELLAANLTAKQTESLLLWGGADADGELYLNPAFVVDAPPVLLDAAGEHRISGRTADGDELFSLDFALPETADGDGRGSFVFALPADPAWAGNLASITLSGPTGSATLDGDTDLPMTVLLDPVSGQVRAILRDLPPVAQAARDTAGRSAEPGLDMIFSRGIPDAAAWRR